MKIIYGGIAITLGLLSVLGIMFATRGNTDFVPNLTTKGVYEAVNNYRVTNGLQPLVWNKSLCPFTQKRLTQIKTNYSHDGFFPAKNWCVHCAKAGENLSGSIYSVKILIDAWTSSPEHKENILDPRFTDTCVALDSPNVVQEFASYK